MVARPRRAAPRADTFRVTRSLRAASATGTRCSSTSYWYRLQIRDAFSSSPSAGDGAAPAGRGPAARPATSARSAVAPLAVAPGGAVTAAAAAPGPVGRRGGCQSAWFPTLAQLAPGIRLAWPRSSVARACGSRASRARQLASQQLRQRDTLDARACVQLVVRLRRERQRTLHRVVAGVDAWSSRFPAWRVRHCAGHPSATASAGKSFSEYLTVSQHVDRRKV